jgi:hypothetical protein
MRKTTLRRLEALEKEQRLHKKRELSSRLGPLTCIWLIVFAYYLGDLESDEEERLPEWLEAERLSVAIARALEYPSEGDYYEAVIWKGGSGLDRRHNDAYRRLFAKVGLDFDGASSYVLFETFVSMVEQLPNQWLNCLRSDLRKYYSDAEIAPGSGLPHGLSPDNFLLFR